MIIGAPKEVKDNENRVSVTPAGVDMLVASGHTVLIEKGAGLGTGISDDAYVAAGGQIVDDVKDVWGKADIICKVKEPQPKEWPLIKPGQILFTYFHLAPAPELTQAMLKSGATCVAYETIEGKIPGSLPLLAPMSEIAGKMAVQAAATYLEKPLGGRGILLGGAPGVPGATVFVIGGGVAGYNAAKVAAGMGAKVIIADISIDRLRELEHILPSGVITLFSSPAAIKETLPSADVVIGTVLVAGARTPVLVSKADLKIMKPGSVIVDVAIDQGGCIETIKATTHSDPVYTVDGVVHYGVANIPGAVPVTSTYALANASILYLRSIANKGVIGALSEDPGFAKGLNVAGGQLYRPEVGKAQGLFVADLSAWLNG
jgi:alanine dehydrogenase